jgi:hypothetical protein
MSPNTFSKRNSTYLSAYELQQLKAKALVVSLTFFLIVLISIIILFMDKTRVIV